MSGARWVQRLAVLAGVAFGLFALLRGLPVEIPPSWTGADGRVHWLGTPMVAFLLPTAMLVTDLLLRSLCVRHPVDGQDAAAVLGVYDAIMVRITLLAVGVHAMVLAGLLGWLWGRPWTAQIIPLMLGATLMGVGNLLPRMRPNHAMGIRTVRTLSDRAQWLSVHRCAGYVAVGAGGLVMLSAIFVPRPIGPRMILVVGPAALVATWLVARVGPRHVDA
jgi:uncharacterized membrane protein